MKVDEIAQDVFRLSTYMPQMNIEFNQFLVREMNHFCFIPARGSCSHKFVKPSDK